MEGLVASIRRSRFAALVLVAVVGLGWVPRAGAVSPEEIDQKLKALEQEMRSLKQQLEQTKAAPPSQPVAAQPAAAAAVAPAASPAAALADQRAPETPATARPAWLSDFKLGGYGSVRFDASDLKNDNNTFTFRRFVLSGDATIAQRLRGVVEIELERFTELEVERNTVSEGGFQGFSQSIEGSNSSEISLEQAWVEFELAKWARFRTGVVLVPLGRFNLNHDDNKWDLPRRSLVDRGVSVLPATAAWSEVGMGFTGDIPTENIGTFSYQVYGMNGATLDTSTETVARGTGELETEVEVKVRRGTSNIDLKRDKAGALRIAWSPTIGTELGVSTYYGRYTPDFLPSKPVWAVGLDGKAALGPFELEGQYIRTHFDGIPAVARGFARAVQEKSFESATAPLNSVVEFELAGLAETKQGYWVDLRYRFWPEFLSRSVLGWQFDNPQLILTVRGEQVWLDGLVNSVEFEASQLTRLSQENRFVNRATVGLAYRPVPLVVFQAAFERTWTNRGQSLAAVTNFLPARRTEDTANAFLFGVAFGF
jgi:hypothetical protein